MPINVPKGYKSPDVIDRTKGQGVGVGELAKDLWTQAKGEYNDGAARKKPAPTNFYDPQKDAASGAPPQKVPSYKKGGKVHKTGLARLHKGEKVIPKSKVHKVEKLMKKASRKRG